MATRKKNPNAQLIIGLLYLNGYSPAEVARRVGVDRSHVSRVIIGERDSERIKKLIAQIVKKPVRELWAA